MLFAPDMALRTDPLELLLQKKIASHQNQGQGCLQDHRQSFPSQHLLAAYISLGMGVVVSLGYCS